MIQKLNVFIIWHGQSIFVKIRIKQLKKVFNRGNFVGSVGVHKNPFLILAWVRWKNNKHFRANTSVPMKYDEHQMLQYSILLRLNFWWAYIYFSARYLKKKRVDLIIFQTLCLLKYVRLTLQWERSEFPCEIQFRFLERFEDLCTWFYELRFLMIWKRGVNKTWYSHKIQLSFIYLPKLINTALLMWYEVKCGINKSVCKPQKVKEHDFLT